MSKEHQFEPLLNDEDTNSHLYIPRSNVSQKRPFTVYFSIALILSMCLNLFQAIMYAPATLQEKTNAVECRSQYANLKDNEISVKWLQSSVYTDGNITKRDRMWDAINHDSGVVAVPKSWATQKGLTLGADFPWDTSKTVYLVNAYHSLHCVKNIYRSLMEYRDGLPQSFDEHHIVHCLDQLRADIKCNADDTLRVTTPNGSKSTAVGQIRQCRSWDELEAWTLAHPGCYRYGNPAFEDAQKSQLPRKRFCPEGSPDLDTVRAYFGKGPDWTPANDPVWSWFDEE